MLPASSARQAEQLHPLCPALLKALLNQKNPYRHISAPVILCIGTDRIIGDSLGPLTGTLLRQRASCRLSVYGTLQETVHAQNLSDVMAQIQKKHPDSPVIAVDASLGQSLSVGSVFVRSGSLRPGAGVHKNLPAAGNIAITGIAGVQSCQPYLALQTARLSVIMQMAEQICDCITAVCGGHSPHPGSFMNSVPL